MIQANHFFGVELFESHLYLHLNLGTGHVKLRASQQRVDDAHWHQLDIERRDANGGTITLDGVAHEFQTPGGGGGGGELLLEQALYVGGVPAHVGPPHPPAMWAATLGLGYVGCVRDLSINGQPIQLSEMAEEQDSGTYWDRGAGHGYVLGQRAGLGYVLGGRAGLRYVLGQRSSTRMGTEQRSRP